MSLFENIKFIQGDCLDEDSLPIVLNDCDCVIHMVGAILDTFNYKKVLQSLKFNQEVKSPQECILGKIKKMQELNPMHAMNDLKEASEKAREVFVDITTTEQKDSLEA